MQLRLIFHKTVNKNSKSKNFNVIGLVVFQELGKV